MECEFPTVNSDDSGIKEILESVKTIAIMGLSPDESKASNMVAKFLQSKGYKIVPVYPKEDEILGEKVSILALFDKLSQPAQCDRFRAPKQASR